MLLSTRVFIYVDAANFLTADMTYLPRSNSLSCINSVEVFVKSKKQSKWVIVSNRLPLKYGKSGKLVKGDGGLVTAISGIKSSQEMLWVGCVPTADGEPAGAAARNFSAGLREIKGKINYQPVFVSERLYDNYYNGFCNDVFWPMFHYEPNLVSYSPENWRCYKKVNQMFAMQLAETVEKDDVVWIHDFHLFLVGKYLKELRPELKVGFFLHIPFPSSELFRQLPCADEILEAMCELDLIGFHDYGYLRHFCQSVKEQLGIDSSLMSIETPHHIARLGVFPASIDSSAFVKRARSKKAEDQLKKWRSSLPPGTKTIIGVDRLDYAKGIDLKLEAYGQFLAENPEFRGKVQLIQLAIPSRTTVPEYMELRSKVEMLVSDINGRFGTADYVPVKYLFNTMTSHELSALYRLGDVLLVTSKRDGMNLVCLEYVVSKSDKNPGRLLLSRFAGASSTLFNAIPINPWDIEDTSKALASALRMNPSTVAAENREMKEYLNRYDATAWSKRFMQELLATREERSGRSIELSLGGGHNSQALFGGLKSAKNINIFLDFDGTLSPIVADPKNAKMPKGMRSLLNRLLGLKQVSHVTIVSGRNPAFLEKHFPGHRFSLAAEHGALFRPSKSVGTAMEWQSLVDKRSRLLWESTVKKTMEDFCTRVPGAAIEYKETSIAWHYRNAPQNFAGYQARKLKLELESLVSNFAISVVNGKKVIEVKDSAANKGAFIEWFNANHSQDFAVNFAMGDDVTDEDMFAYLRPRNSDQVHDVAIKIGGGETLAGFRLREQKEVAEFIKELCDFLEE